MLVTILTIAQIVYVVALATWILLEKRSPVATLAWIMSLVALPYVGFIVFFFLGPRRLSRKRLRHKRARGKVLHDALPAPEPLALEKDPRVAQLVRLAVRTGEPPADHADDVAIYHDAPSTYDAIEKALADAKDHVHVGYYIFDARRTGTRFRDALIACAKRGVTVRLLVDDVGSSTLNPKFLAPMRAAGVHFAKFNEVSFSRIRSRFDFRNHRKIVVCDGCVGFTGGINFADEYLPGDEPTRKDLGPWRDTHVRFRGDAVRWLQLTFLDDWYYATGFAVRDAAFFPRRKQTGTELVQVVASGPDRDVQPIQSLFFAAIASSRSRVYVTTPYFVPDDAVLKALTTAALRGVDVRILVPRRSDSLIVTAAARSYYDTVLASGARIFEYQPTMIHSKTIAVDDFFASIGTANVDNRSFRLNFEVTAVLYSEAHTEELARQFRLDLRSSKEIRAHDRLHISVGWRLAEAGARVFSPLL